MTNFVKGKYGLIEPGDGITAISMEGGEINLFGNYTLIKTSAKDEFPPINDVLAQKQVEEKSAKMYKVGMGAAIVLGVIAGVALVAAVAIPIGVALGTFALSSSAAGASVIGLLGSTCIWQCIKVRSRLY